MKGYSVLPRFPEQLLHHQMQFSLIQRTSLFERKRVSYAFTGGDAQHVVSLADRGAIRIVTEENSIPAGLKVLLIRLLITNITTKPSLVL